MIAVSPDRRSIKKEKEVETIIKITPEEKEYLLNEKHLIYGDGGLHHTTARHRRTYWLTESKRNLQYLNEFRQKRSTV